MRQNRSFIIIGLIVFLLILGHFLWAQDKGTPEKPWIIGMSRCNLGEPWRVQMNNDIKTAAKKHNNIKAIYKDAQNDTLKQRAHIEEFIGQKVDLLIVSPKEAAPLTPPVRKAYKSGIPVIVFLGD